MAAVVVVAAASASAFELGPGAPRPLPTFSGSGSFEFGPQQPVDGEAELSPSVLALPDLFVYAIEAVDASYNPLPTIAVGQAVYFKLSIANGGTGYCTDSAIDIEVTMDSAFLEGGSLDLTGLSPGYYTNVYSSTPWLASGGTHTTRLTLDINAVQPETNEANNWSDFSFTTGTSSGSCDLTIVNEIQACDTSKVPVSSVVSGQAVLFRFQVGNLGTAYPTATSVAITATIDGANLGGGNYNLTSLPPGYYVSFYTSTWVATPGNHTVVVTVDAYGAQAESNEANNSQTDSFTIASTCAMSCAASVSSFGQAGSSVLFGGSAVLSGCSSTSVSYDWDFGDGSSHGSSQNTVHSYPVGGTYAWTMTATSSGVAACTQSGTIVIAASCSPPEITTEPGDVTIQPGNQTILTLGASGTSLTYQWYYGSSGDLTRPIGYANNSWYSTEALNTTTSFWVRAYNACGQDDSRTVTVVVNGGGPNCSGTPVLLPAVAHSPGEADTFWQSDLSVLNTDASPVSVWLRFLPRDVDNSSALCIAAGTIAGGAGVGFDDVVHSVFGFDNAVGGLGVYFDYGMPMVASQTYTSTADGSYGQSIPGRQPSEGIAAGETRTLLQLHENASHRTNLGFQNAATSVSTVEVELFNEGGVPLGTVTVVLEPYAQHQEGRIFRAVTAAEIRNGRAEIRVLSGGPVLAYSSVVDFLTGDPSYSEPMP